MHGGHPDPDACDRLHAWWARVREEVGHGGGFTVPQCRLGALRSGGDGLSTWAEADVRVRLPPTLAAADAARAVGDGCSPTIHEAVEAVAGDPPRAFGRRLAWRAA